MPPKYTQGTDPLSNAPKDNTNPGGNSSTDWSSTPRYSSIDEMRAEFGDYRVNKEDEKLSDASIKEPIADDMVTNDPFKTQMADNDIN